MKFLIGFLLISSLGDGMVQDFRQEYIKISKYLFKTKFNKHIIILIVLIMSDSIEVKLNQSSFQTHSHFPYRADIDGLRAFAITIVVIVHGWMPILPGGYVGVIEANWGQMEPNTHIRKIAFTQTFLKWRLFIEILVPGENPAFILFIIKFTHYRGLQILTLFTLFSFTFGIILMYYNKKWAFYFPLCRFWEMSIGGLLSYQNLKIKDQQINNLLSTVGFVAIIIFIFFVNIYQFFPGWLALIPTLSTACIILAGNQSFINKYILSSRPFVFVGNISYALYLWHYPFFKISRFIYSENNDSIFAQPSTMLLISIVISILTYFFIEKPLRYQKSKIVVIALLVIMLGIGALSVVIYKNPEIFSLKQQKFNQSIKDYQNSMEPEDNDYYLKGQIKIPNQSKSKNRKIPTFQQFEYFGERLNLQKSQFLFSYRTISEQSKFFNSSMPLGIQIYSINQNSDNIVFFIGDSYAQNIVLRFQQLYEQSLNYQSSHNFPTIVCIIEKENIFLSKQTHFSYSMEMIRKWLPKRILVMNHWLYYFKNARSEIQMDQMIETITEGFKEITKLGIQVSTANISPEGEQFSNVYKLYQQNKIVMENIKPFNYTKFRIQNEKVFFMFQTAVNETGVKLLSFIDNLCWQNICQPLMPSGNPVYRNGLSYSYPYARYWLSQVDFLVKFGNQKQEQKEQKRLKLLKKIKINQSQKELI